MNIATGEQPIYTGHLKNGEELYVMDNTITVISEKKGNIFSTELGKIRCAYPVGQDTVRIFWRSPKNEKNSPILTWHRYHYDLTLDIKKMFTDKKERKEAEKHESEKLAKLILEHVHKQHDDRENIREGYLAMHSGEYVVNKFEGQTKMGRGDITITNLGVYFVAFGKGLGFDMPLNYLDAFNPHGKTVKIFYFEPKWVDGYESTSKKNRNIEIRIHSASAEDVCEAIKTAYSDGGAQEAREFSTYGEQFGSLTPDQYFKTFFSGKAQTESDIDKYVKLLAKEKWGAPPTPEIQYYDTHIIQSCLVSGIPIDAAGDLDPEDVKYRKMIRDYFMKWQENANLVNPLTDDYIKLVTTNLDEEASQEVNKFSVFLIHEALLEIAKTGELGEFFVSETQKLGDKWCKELNTKLVANEVIPRNFSMNLNITNFWSKNGANALLNNQDYQAIMEKLEKLYLDFDPVYRGRVRTDPAAYAACLYKKHSQASFVRNNRVYDEWCKTHDLTKFDDPYDYSWAKYIYENITDEKVEMIARYMGESSSPIDEIRDSIAESDNTKARLESAIIPEDIPKEDVYVDAWYDRKIKRWFTTNPYPKINFLDLKIMTEEACEQKYGIKAAVFTDDVVEMKYGYPAVFLEQSQCWILLSTVPEKDITLEMLKAVHNSTQYNCDIMMAMREDGDELPEMISYNVIEPSVSILNNGSLCLRTEKEMYLTHQMHVDNGDDIWGGMPLPFNERLRRFMFYMTCNLSTDVKKSETLIPTLITK